jgi:hypothetical protein
MDNDALTLIAQLVADGGLIAFCAWRIMRLDILVNRLLDDLEDKD